MQKRTHSFIESVTNTVVGWTINMVAQVFVFPLFGIHVPFSTNLKLSVIFTLISIARGYVLRRVFTKKTEKTSAHVLIDQLYCILTETPQYAASIALHRIKEWREGR